MAADARPIRKVLVANRSEIAIRVLRAANELGIRTVAIFSHQDRYALHRFKADEAYPVGAGLPPVRAYLDIPEVLRVAKHARVDAIHPGYGFLSENPDFAAACGAEGLTFIGPPPDVMHRLGSKLEARRLAEQAGLAVMPATGPLPRHPDALAAEAERIGYPVMAKASWGGGGRGMRVIEHAGELQEQVALARREAMTAFGNDEVFLERLVRRARHVEVQLIGDGAGTVVHLFERDCSMQRRNQKVVERAPAPYLTREQSAELCEGAVRLARAAGYRNAGTAEFLMDADTGRFYFIEVNPRIQVEHTVTEVITGIDIVKAQIRIAEGARIGDPASGVPMQDDIRANGHALQCRITTEDPENRFVPDYGRITAYRGANGFGIRLDGGTAYSGAVITPYYDSLLEKVTAWASSADEAAARMDRALREFRIRGVATNLRFLEALVGHADFRSGNVTTTFIDDTPALFDFKPRRDRATRLLNFMGEVLVNGNEDVKGRQRPDRAPGGRPSAPTADDPPPGSRQRLDALGPEGLARWMSEQKRTLITDTTMRDAHQSLIATRMRSHDMVAMMPHYARLLPGLLSMECWGGATFDVAMRFLREDPWERLAALRDAAPNILLQALVRGANGVGYTNYPDNVVRFFIRRAAASGIDLFRVLDCLNWVESMRPTMDAILEEGKLCEAAICYSGDLTDPDSKYTLKYYVELARELEAAGAHIIAIKDMAGLCKPKAAQQLIAALRKEIGAPLHFHTHDTSGIAAASVLAAAEAGCDAIDAAMDSWSGMTSQPNLGAIVEALRGTDLDPGFDRSAMRRIDAWWEDIRQGYAAFESGMRSGSSTVFQHGMPGGQFTNLREQARALGLEKHWPEVEQAFSDVNDLFGDIIKVTPTSKVVGDMALTMVSSGLGPEDVADPDRDVSFPSSVVAFFKGELGQPADGFPAELQARILKGAQPITERPGVLLPPTDLAAARREAERKVRRTITDNELASYLMYPEVFLDFAAHLRTYSDVGVLPTPVFFFGPARDEEFEIEIERGKTLLVTFLALGEADSDGVHTLFFELNGQPRTVRIANRALADVREARRKADESSPGQVGAPMPGRIVGIAVGSGEKVRRGDALFTIEAMKMESVVFSEIAGTVQEIVLPAGHQVDVHDLVIVISEDE